MVRKGSPSRAEMCTSPTGNRCIRRVAPNGTISTLAEGFSDPRGVEVDADGSVYVADASGGHRVLRVDPTTGEKAVVAGTGQVGSTGDGSPAVGATLNQPDDVAIVKNGELYISDTQNHRIRRVDVSGRITTIAGIGTSGIAGVGGPAAEAQVGFPADRRRRRRQRVCRAP